MWDILFEVLQIPGLDFLLTFEIFRPSCQGTDKFHQQLGHSI